MAVNDELLRGGPSLFDCERRTNEEDRVPVSGISVWRILQPGGVSTWRNLWAYVVSLTSFVRVETFHEEYLTLAIYLLTLRFSWTVIGACGKISLPYISLNTT